MAHTFAFKVTVAVNRTRGKFATRDDLYDVIKEALDSANPGDIQAGDEGEYEVTDWDVEDM